MPSEPAPANPMVTVVMPCFNHARWVGGALASVAAQTYRNRRAVVVDDCSGDDSVAAVLGDLRDVVTRDAQTPAVHFGKFRDTDLGVLLVALPANHGPAFARNWGINAGRDGSDLVAFLDSDDLYAPAKLEASVPHFADPAVGVVYSDYETFAGDGVRVREFKPPYSRAALLQSCIINCDSVVSMKALDQVGLFDEGLRVAEDYDLWLRVTEKSLAVHVPEALVYIRTGAHSSTATVPGETWKLCHERVGAKLRQRMGVR